MPSPRTRMATAKPVVRSPARAKMAAKTAAAAARKATLAACAKPVDATIRLDAFDADGQERAAYIIARNAKVVAEAADSDARPASKKPARRTSAAKKSVAEKSAAKRLSGKTTSAKISTRKKPARKAAPRRKAASQAEADHAAMQPADPTPETAENAATSDAAMRTNEIAAADAMDEPRRRGPSGVTRTAVDRADDPPPASGVPLIDRVSRAVEREITQIEVIVGGHHLKPSQRTEAERRARTLASLARTLAELRKLRSDEDRKRARDDDAIPRDLDELRRALSRRLDQMVAGAAGLPAAGDD